MNGGHDAADVAHIRAARAALGGEIDVFGRNQALRRFFGDRAEGIVLFEGSEPAGIVYFEPGAERRGTRRESAVYLFVFADERVEGVAAQIAFKANSVGYGVDGGPALGHYRVEADELAVEEGLAQGVDRRKSHVRRVKGVYAAVRRAARVRRLAFIDEALGDDAVGAPAAGDMI